MGGQQWVKVFLLCFKHDRFVMQYKRIIFEEDMI